MNVQTVLLIILAAIVALGLVLFQYRARSKKKGRLSLILSLVRFMTLFGVLLLLINPTFTKNTYTLQKTKLLVLADNSSSVMGSDELSLVQTIKADPRLGERFDMNFHSFGSQLNANDSLTFRERNTNISTALKTLRSIYGGTNGTLVMLTDGNQTLGDDYEFYGKDLGIPIYPIVVGDTTRYEDLRIGQVNSNKYAFLKNKYPIEVFVS